MPAKSRNENSSEPQLATLNAACGPQSTLSGPAILILLPRASKAQQAGARMHLKSVRRMAKFCADQPFGRWLQLGAGCSRQEHDQNKVLKGYAIASPHDHLKQVNIG